MKVMLDAADQLELPAENPGALARLERAGGKIRNFAVNAAFLAAEAGEPVGMAHLMRSARQEYRKLDKMPGRWDFGDYYQAVRQ